MKALEVRKQSFQQYSQQYREYLSCSWRELRNAQQDLQEDKKTHRANEARLREEMETQRVNAERLREDLEYWSQKEVTRDGQRRGIPNGRGYRSTFKSRIS